MHTTPPPVRLDVAPTLAAQAAARNFQANLDALDTRQPALAEVMRHTRVTLTWVFARDGFLTGQDATGQWWTWCSLPLRAAEAMLRNLHVRGTTACFLMPSHAAQIRVALDRLTPQQALIALAADEHGLAVALHCCDFSAEIRAGRLLFAWGQEWPRRLLEAYADHPALPVPQQFIKTSLISHEQITNLTTVAQEVFAEQGRRAGQLLQRLHQSWSPSSTGPRPLCIVAPSAFALWDDAGAVLADVLVADAPGTWIRYDPDQPTMASGVGLARAAAECGAVVAANLSRAQIGAAVPPRMPIVTWLTAPPVPTFDPANPQDALLVADPAWRGEASRAGWPSCRVALAEWPAPATPPPAPAAACLAAIADTHDVTSPPQPFELSSHQLLWDLIRNELARNPFALGTNMAQYLASRMKRLEIAPETLDHRLFVERLVVPAWQQALVRVLARAGLPLRLFGHGWDTLEDLKDLAAGPIEFRADLRTACEGATALLHLWPTGHRHPIEFMGRPVVRVAGSAQDWIRDACAALQGRIRYRPPATAVSAPKVRNLLDLTGPR